VLSPGLTNHSGAAIICKRILPSAKPRAMDNFVDSGIDVPQREFVYRTWQITSRIEGQEKWKITRHEIIRKTSTLIYAYCEPYFDEKYGWEKAESSFELSRKELEEQGRCWVSFMSTNFYPSQEAALAAIPKRVH
jgi:hypothetical protein